MEINLYNKGSGFQNDNAQQNRGKLFSAVIINHIEYPNICFKSESKQIGRKKQHFMAIYRKSVRKNASGAVWICG